jgi:hypothetical protein
MACLYGSFSSRVQGVGFNFVIQFVWPRFLLLLLIVARILGVFGATAAFVVLLFNKNIPLQLELEEITI